MTTSLRGVELRRSPPDSILRADPPTPRRFPEITRRRACDHSSPVRRGEKMVAELSFAEGVPMMNVPWSAERDGAGSGHRGGRERGVARLLPPPYTYSFHYIGTPLA